MYDIAMTTLTKRFLTLKNFLWLFLMFAVIQYLDEVLESLGITIENTILDYVFDGVQMVFIGICIYIFLQYVEKSVQNSLLKETFLRAVTENMDEGVSVCDKDGNLLYMNGTSSQRVNKDFLSFPIPYEHWTQKLNIYEDDNQEMNTNNIPLLRALRGEEVKHQQLIYKPNGESAQFHSVNGKQITSKTGEIIGALVVIHDITEQKRAEQKIKYMAYHDNLTGLPNLRFFKEKVSGILEVDYQNKTSKPLAIMFLDLDGFKAVNDNFGHDMGDLLLIEVCKRITACLPDSDLAARIGGDEFTILLRDIKAKEDAIAVAHSIINKVGYPYDIHGNKLQVTTSIGISFYPYDGSDKGTLMKNADTAMYTAKKNGKNQYCVFHDIKGDRK
ncbi:diguanylate cyclase domain-containing protein [Bacillus sp. Marseille-P3661]|uniref:diguanylate cyclase domain-containing protein n=1 Tax=Bacillus sp. Marseille-P3661 TaxID=1936234 RepID=UPI000C81D643|nr:diguanylate cyclase [Bacillus sp. Marseille-P3661]